MEKEIIEHRDDSFRQLCTDDDGQSYGCCSLEFLDDRGKPSYSIGCTCSCTLCSLRNPDHLYEMIRDRSYEFDRIANMSDIVYNANIPPEIGKPCRIETLIEGLEHLKNHNRRLKNLLKRCHCSPKNLNTSQCITHLGKVTATRSCKRTSSLIGRIKIFQDKCRTKDGMIVVLANEIIRTRGSAVGQSTRILRDLIDPDVSRRAANDSIDFDRQTLWKHLANPLTDNYYTKTGRNLEKRDRRKHITLGLVLLLLLILLPKIVSAIYHMARFTKNTIFKLYESLSSYEFLKQVPLWIYKIFSTVIYLFFTMLNDWLLPTYMYTTEGSF